MTKHTHRATCQACGRVQALRADGNLAKHGYTVDYGWFNGTCMGSDNKPVEHDLTVLNTVCNSLAEQAESYEGMTAADIRDVTITMRLGVDKKDYHVQSDEEIQQLAADVDPRFASYRFGRLVEDRLRALKSHAKQMREHVAFMYGVAKDRHGAEPYAVAEMAEQAAAAKAEKAAKPTKASVKRTTDRLNREFETIRRAAMTNMIAAARANDTDTPAEYWEMPDMLHNYRTAKHRDHFIGWVGTVDADRVEELVRLRNEARDSLK